MNEVNVSVRFMETASILYCANLCYKDFSGYCPVELTKDYYVNICNFCIFFNLVENFKI
jgi:hypothetical protein